MAVSVRSRALEALEKGNGVLRLAPAWVPRSFCVPGRRIKLHPDDYYAFGAVRGGIDERWLSSESAATRGIEIANASECDPLVILKQFGPSNPDLREGF